MFDNNNNFIKNTDINKNGGGSVPFYITSPVGRGRYLVEHRFLWEQFFRDPKMLIGNLLVPGGIFFIFEKLMFSVGRIHCPYRMEDFRISLMDICDPNNIIAMLEMPYPDLVPLCYRIYLLHDKKYMRFMYFTVERGQNGAFLCRWDENGVHYNYGMINTAEWNEQNRDFQSYLEAQVITNIFNGVGKKPEARSLPCSN